MKGNFAWLLENKRYWEAQIIYFKYRVRYKYKTYSYNVLANFRDLANKTVLRYQDRKFFAEETP